MHHVLPPEKYFRWRAGEITRLEAFCDVVFGFAITLLVVSLEVPRNFNELLEAMRGFFPFAFCFAQFVFIWVKHYRFSRRYGLEDGYTVFLNVLLLFLVLFYVYPLKFLFMRLLGGLVGMEGIQNMRHADVSLLMQVYGMGWASVFALFAFMYLHAYRLRDKLDLSAVETIVTRASLQENVALMSFGLVSFFLAFRHPTLSGFLYDGLAIFYPIHNMITRKHIQLSTAKAAAEARKSGEAAVEI